MIRITKHRDSNISVAGSRQEFLLAVEFSPLPSEGTHGTLSRHFFREIARTQARFAAPALHHRWLVAMKGRSWARAAAVTVCLAAAVTLARAAAAEPAAEPLGTVLGIDLGTTYR